MMATQSDADLNISYYGVGIDGLLGDLPNAAHKLVIHIAELDQYVPSEAQQKILSATADNKLVDAYVYPGANHAFARVGGIHWDTRSAWIANGRSAAALAEVLG